MEGVAGEVGEVGDLEVVVLGPVDPVDQVVTDHLAHTPLVVHPVPIPHLVPLVAITLVGHQVDAPQVGDQYLRHQNQHITHPLGLGMLQRPGSLKSTVQ